MAISLPFPIPLYAESLLIGKNNYKFLVFLLKLQYTSFLDLIISKSRVPQLKEHMRQQHWRAHLLLPQYLLSYDFLPTHTFQFNPMVHATSQNVIPYAFLQQPSQLKQILPNRTCTTKIWKEQWKGNSFPDSPKNLGCLLQETGLVHIVYGKFFISPSFVKHIKHLGRLHRCSMFWRTGPQSHSAGLYTVKLTFQILKKKIQCTVLRQPIMF